MFPSLAENIEMCFFCFLCSSLFNSSLLTPTFCNLYFLLLSDTFNPILTDLFVSAHGWGGEEGSLPKICHPYPTVMKLGTVIPCLKKIQIYINHMTHPLSSTDSIFPPEISNFCYIKKYRCRLHFNI